MLTSGLDLRAERSLSLSYHKTPVLSQKSSSSTCAFFLTALVVLILCSRPRPSRSADGTGPTLPAPFPPKTLPEHEWLVEAPVQEHEGRILHLRGHPAELEDYSMLLRADQIDFNGETHDVVARGNVYYHNFDKNEELWCDHMEYNTEKVDGQVLRGARGNPSAHRLAPGHADHHRTVSLRRKMGRADRRKVHCPLRMGDELHLARPVVEIQRASASSFIPTTTPSPTTRSSGCAASLCFTRPISTTRWEKYPATAAF